MSAGQSQPPTPTNRQPMANNFLLNAQDMLLRYSVTHGLDYTVTVRLVPGNDAYPQTEIIPGWLHGFITHLIAMEEATNPMVTVDDIPNVFVIQRALNEHHNIHVPENIILALIYEYVRLSRDIRVAWRTRVIPLPPPEMIEDRWRVVRDHDVVDPRTLDIPRVEQQGPVLVQPVRRVARPPPQLVRPAAPQPQVMQASRSQQPDHQAGATNEDSSADPNAFTRRVGGRLRDLGRRVSYRLNRPSTRRTAVEATPVPVQNTNSPARSASPPRDPDDQPQPRLRSPLPQRSNTVTGTSLTRRLSNRVRNLGNSVRGRRDRSNSSAQNPAVQTRSPSHDRFIGQAFRAQDRDRDISDVLADVGLNAGHDHPGRDLLLEDRNLRVFMRNGPGIRDDDPAQSAGPLFGDDDDDDNHLDVPNQRLPSSTTADDFLNLRGQPTISIDDVDLDQVTNPFAAPQSYLNTRATATRTYVINGPPPATTGLVPAPAQNVQSPDSPVLVPRQSRSLTQWQPSNTPSATNQLGGRAAPFVGPNGVSLPTVATLPGNPPTLHRDATQQQIDLFVSVWQPGQHVPDVIPGHVFVCPVQGCNARTEYKRGITRHLRTVHGLNVDTNAMNQRLPVPGTRVNRGRRVMSDAQGTDADSESGSDEDA